MKRAAFYLLVIAAFGLTIFLAAGSQPAAAFPPQGEITPTPPPRPPGPDLDVTYISRSPLYNSYCVEYPDDIPQLCSGTENEPRWPEYLEQVTYQAHIVNHGTQDSSPAKYTWELDGVQFHTGNLPGLAVGEEVIAQISRPWPNDLDPDDQHAAGTHIIAFTVDSLNQIAEPFETNNRLEFDTLAMSFRIVITSTMIAAYDIPVAEGIPWSAEDWLQKQIAEMNATFARSSYPASPDGATQRVRIDQIIVSEFAPEIDRQFDGGWFVDADYRRGASAWYDPSTDIDPALIHELSHQVGMIDLYMSNIPINTVEVLDEDGRPVNFAFEWPNAGLMGGGDISPHNPLEGILYSSHDAAGVSTQRGYRNGYYGVYQYDIPLENTILILDRAGSPAAGVQVDLYQRDPPTRWPWFANIDNTPEISGVTNAEGKLLLTNRSANGGTTTKTGHVLRDNPFGVVDFIHTRNRFLVRLRLGEHEEFTWLDITAFNLAFWSGDTNAHTYTIQTNIPALPALSAPVITYQRVEANRVTLCWQAVQNAVSYNLYRAEKPVYPYQKVASGLTELCFEDEHNDDSSAYGGFIYALSAVDSSGRESGFSDFAWAPNLNTNLSDILVLPNGERLVLDSNFGFAVDRQAAEGRYLSYFSFSNLQLYSSHHLGADSNGNILFSQNGDLENPNHKIIVVDPNGALIRTFGESGSGPGQLRVPEGVTGWGSACSIEGPYLDDEKTLLLLHFDGSYTGSQGEVGTALGTGFVTGKYNQGVWIDHPDLISYDLAGNLDLASGSIEFWIKPNWNGSDLKSYVFFQAGLDWFNRLRIMKDGANNLRFMAWDSTTEYGLAHNVSDWLAGEWHHVGVTWQGTKITLWVDGEQVEAGSAVMPAEISAETMEIGGVSNEGGMGAQAVIDEVRISEHPRIGNSDHCGRILVVDSGNHRIQAFDHLGNFVSAFGTHGSGIGQFDFPTDIVVDSSGRVLITDTGNNRIVALDFDGQQFSYLTSYSPGLDYPNGIAVDSFGRFYIADTGTPSVPGHHRIVVMSADGKFLNAVYAADDGYSGAFYKPYDVDVAADGRLVIVDTGNRRVVTAWPFTSYLPVIQH